MTVNDIDFNKDYYKILEVDKSADADAIKKAFRKASLKWHPDRNPGDKDAEEKFKEVNDAYSILSDDNLRKAYDAGPSMGFDFETFGMNPFAHHQEEIIPVVAEMSVTFDDICKGVKDRPVKYTRTVQCEYCHGKGGDGYDTCPTCHGSGFKVQTTRKGNSVYQQMTICPDCHGQGHFVKNACPHCHGSGLIEESQVFNVTANRDNLIENGTNLFVGLYGNINKDGKPGPLIINVRHDLPEGMEIQRSSLFGDAFNIIKTVKLPYYDMLLGTSVKVTTPNGKTIAIKIPEGTQHGHTFKAAGQGFFGGHYIIITLLETSKPTKDEIKLLEKIRDLKSK